MFFFDAVLAIAVVFERENCSSTQILRKFNSNTNARTQYKTGNQTGEKECKMNLVAIPFDHLRFACFVAFPFQMGNVFKHRVLQVDPFI